jgi:hypothetical protein
MIKLFYLWSGTSLFYPHPVLRRLVRALAPILLGLFLAQIAVLYISKGNRHEKTTPSGIPAGTWNLRIR